MDHLVNKFVRGIGVEIFSKYGSVNLKDINIDKISGGFEVEYTESVPEEFIDCLLLFLDSYDEEKEEKQEIKNRVGRRWLKISGNRI